METILGRQFSDEILARIQNAIASDPGLSRRKLSLLVCEWMDWRNSFGRLQEMSCRKALLELDRRGAIKLPVPRRAFTKPLVRREFAPPPISPVEGELADLGKIEMVRVDRGAHSLAWRGMLDAFHYLKSGPLCGAQARYLVRSEFHGWVGALSFSACALRVECRENWIGWNEASRRERLNLVVNKTIEEKESRKWLESYRAVSAVQNRCRRTKLVMVADREADLHELFVEHQKTAHGAELLIRAERSRNRKVVDQEENHDYLWSILEKQSVIETKELYS